MAPLQLLVAAAAAFSLLAQSPPEAVAMECADDASAIETADDASAVETADDASATDASTSVTPTPPQRVLSLEEACPLPGGIMRVLVVLETVGVTRIDRTSKLVTKDGIKDTERLPVRAPNWVAPEPPVLPLLYSRMMQLDF
jgi:hypothetical protein